MFFLKKLVAPLFFPMTLCLLLLGAGVLLLWLTRRQRTGKVLVTLGFAALVLLGYPAVTRQALIDLERAYPALAAPDASIRWIVVLGGGASADPAVPAHARLPEGALARMVEAIRLHRLAPGSRLILSGGGEDDAEVKAMRAFAESLGVSPGSLTIDRLSRDTETQALKVKALLGAERCVLVTSASHMRRALGLFRKAGVDAIPAPTDWTSHAGPWMPGDLYPSSEGLSQAETLAHEYLGMAWAKLRGLI